MAFVVTEGALASTDRPATPAPFALTLDSGHTQTYATIWRCQPQVRTVVSFLARNIAELTIAHYRRNGDTDRERLSDSPVHQLLAHPGPHTTRFRLFRSLINDMGIYDVAYWAKVKGENGAPGALVRLDPRRVKPLGTNPFWPDQFELRGSTGVKALNADQVIYFHGYSPEDERGGCPPIEALRQILVEEWQATQYREQLWRNGARMSGYLSRPTEAPKWSDTARKRFRREWQGQYLGDGPNAGGTPILEDGMTWTSAAVTPEQAEYTAARKLTREECAAAYHVPLPMVGILDHATFSNIKEQHKQLYMDCLGPWLKEVTEELELQLVPDFEADTNTYLEFNLAAKMRGSFEEQAAQLSTSVGGPWMTRNEARAIQNLPPVDGGDDLITPLNVTAGGQASPQDGGDPAVDSAGEETGKARRRKAPRLVVKAQAPADQVERGTKTLAKFFERQGQAVASALGAEKAARRAGRKADAPSVNDLTDWARWDGELAADLFALNASIATSCAHSTLEALGEDPDDYDEERTQHWLSANAERTAGAVNGTTKAALILLLASAVDDPVGAVQDLFARYVGQRAAQLAVSHATSLAGFGTTEAARQTDRESTKTWRVRSSNPRKSHKALNGETVGLKENFSNGAPWPGDSSLDEDERCGCTCDVEIEFAD